MERQDFTRGTAVVTGAASGIGAGFARHLVDRGMTVVVADIDRAAAEALVAELGEDRARAHQVDVTDPDAVERLAADVYADHGSVELLINNAGIESSGLLWEVDLERWHRVMQVNVDGVLHGVRAFVPRMIAAGTPACVANMSSVGGINTAAVQAPYIVSKFAVQALTESLYQDLSLVDAPIQVSVLVPASVRSQIFLSAQSQAPTTNATANAVFDAMQHDNVTTGLDPVEAAVHMVNQLADGEFWVWSEDGRCTDAARRRAQQLLDRRPPSDPRIMLDRMGIAHPTDIS